MAAATACTLLAPALLDSGKLQHRHTNSSLGRSNGGMFHSIKKSLSRKGQQPVLPTTSSPDGSDININNPYRNDSNRTRRPVNPAGINNAFSNSHDPNQAPPPPYSPDSVPQTQSNYAPLQAQPASRAEAGFASQSSFQQSSTSNPHARSTADGDKYAFLETFDTIFLIDDSGSMAGGMWTQASAALEAIAPICTKYDEDGVDIYFLNHKDRPEFKGVKTPQAVREIFSIVSPSRATPTGQRLNKILKPYLAKYEADPENTKPINVICITDGAASDDVEAPIIQAAKKLDKLDAPAWQVGIQFFQIGTDKEAKEALKQLDDDLAEISGEDDLRDIVDTVPFTGANGGRLTSDGILKVVLGAVNRKLDRKKSKDLHDGARNGL